MLEPESLSTQLEKSTNELADDLRTGFEYRVLELIIMSYKKMSQQGYFDVLWKENKFTAILVRCIKQNCRDFSRLTGQNWTVIREYYHDGELISAVTEEHDPDTVPRIDIVVSTWSTDYEEMSFPFECKRIAEHNSDLIRLYVEKGIVDRYLTEKDYSSETSWGGMLGYILEGNVNTIVTKLNKQIDRQRNSSFEHLMMREPVAQFNTMYLSRHPHPKRELVLTITHLFLSFPAELTQ